MTLVGTLYAAEAPFEDFAREYSWILAVIFLLLLGLLVVRLVVRTLTRTVLLGILTLAVLFVTVEREELSECTQTCSCTLAGFDTTVPFCSRDLDRT